MQILGEDFDQNYQQFFENAVAMGCVWGLEGGDGWAQSESEKYPNALVIPFWSQPEYAELHRKDEWADYQVVPIALAEFLDDWLPGMHEDVILAGINWNEELDGDDYEPLDVLSAFEQALA